jgi:hypothetical protein
MNMVSVKHLIGVLLIGLLYSLFAYAFGLLLDDSYEFVPKSVSLLLKRVIKGTALICFIAGVVFAIYAIIQFIGYCFS